MSINQLTLSQKLVGMGTIGAAVTILAAGAGYRTISHLDDTVDEISSATHAVRATMDADMRHEGMQAVVYKLNMSAIKRDKDLRESAIKDFKDNEEGFKKDLKVIRENIQQEPELLKRLDALEPKVHNYIKSTKAFVDASLSPSDEMPSIDEFEKAFSELEVELGAFADAIEKLDDKDMAIADEGATQGKRMLLLFSILSLGAMAFASRMIIQSIRKPIHEMSVAAHEISQGNTHQTIQHRSDDEIGILASSLRELTEYIQSTAHAADTIARGDLSAQIAPRSSYDALSHSFLKMRDSLKQLVAESRTLIDAAREGHLDAHGREQGLEGVYRELVDGMNSVLSAVSAPINEAKDVLDHVKNRDLRARMNGHYSGDYDIVKTSLNAAIENLEKAITEVDVAAEQVASASNQITAGSQHFARSTSSQSSALDEVTAQLQEITAMSKQNATNAQRAQGLASEARTAADHGSSSMERLSKSVDQIKKSADETAKIVKTIDEIAFQTNLLALNAAVEAARAGDAGRGFAVVAEEVRNLAMRSADAARNTAQLIEESVRRAEEGVAINTEATQSFTAIRKQVNQVVEVMGEISTSSNQQSEGVEQINMAVEALTVDTQTNASTTEETAAASEQLAGQATAMKGMTAQFKVNMPLGRSIPPKVAASQPLSPKPVKPAVKYSKPSPVHSAKAPPIQKPMASVAKPVKQAGHASNGAKLIPFESDEATLQRF